VTSRSADQHGAPAAGEIARAVVLMNSGEYRAALICFEEIWHAERTESLRALILLCNALHQLRLGLVTAPRHNLNTAIRLLESNPPPITGIDLAAVLMAARAVRAAIPDEIETGRGSVAWETLPPVTL
jgi:Domain of unknown function (DUF309)